MSDVSFRFDIAMRVVVEQRMSLENVLRKTNWVKTTRVGEARTLWGDVSANIVNRTDKNPILRERMRKQ